MIPTTMRVEPSDYAQRTHNPIRSIVDTLKIPTSEKKLIPLALGDPTAFLQPPTEAIEAVKNALSKHEAFAYPPATGYDSAKEAIANRYRHNKEDVVIASGCSGALELAIVALCSMGSTLAIPRPGFSLYRTIAQSRGIQVYEYLLLSGSNWEIDLEAFNPPANTRAWLINNPSNPCGSVYSEQHLRDCLKRAKELGVPIIADEIYEDMVFARHRYIPIASISNGVPVLTCGGLAKRYLVPGWRVGWILIKDDSISSLSDIRKSLVDLAGIILGANSLVQAALPDIIASVPKSFFGQVNAYLEANAELLYSGLSSIAELRPICPQGAMYMMVQGFDA